MSMHQRSTSIGDWQVFLLLLALGVAVYANSLRGDYHLDDHYNIRENLFVHDLGQIGQYFIDAGTTSSLPENAPYRPLSTVSFALLWAAGDGATWPFHLFKLLAHVFVAWTAFLVARNLLERSEIIETKFAGRLRLRRWDGKDVEVDATTIAFLGSVLFVVHPALSESVNYISALTSVQCALLYMVAFWCFLRGWLVPMLVLFFMSMLTKEEGVTLPLAIGLFQLVFERRSFKPFNKWLISSFVVLAVYLGLRFWLGSKTVVFGIAAPHLYFFTQLRAWVYYLYKIFTPWGYSIEHRSFGFSQGFFEPAVMASAVFVILCTWQAARWVWPGLKRQADLVLGFGWAWYILCLLPSSSIFPLFEPLFEHRYYLSFTLFFPVLIYATFRLLVLTNWRVAGNPAVLSWLLAGVFTVLSALTIRQNIIWRRGVTLWQDVVDKDPLNGRAINNLAVAHQNKGEFENALALFERSEQVAPGYKYAMIGQLACLRQLGRIDAARVVVQRLTTASDGIDSAIVQFHHAQFLLEVEKRPQDALPVLARCQALSGGKSAQCFSLEIDALRDLGRVDQLQRVGERTMQLYPDDRALAFQYGLALITTKQYQEAKRIFDDLYARNGDIQSLHNLAWIDLQLGDFEGAKQKWELKLQLAPGDTAALQHLMMLKDRGLRE